MEENLVLNQERNELLMRLIDEDDRSERMSRQSMSNGKIQFI